MEHKQNESYVIVSKLVTQNEPFDSYSVVPLLYINLVEIRLRKTFSALYLHSLEIQSRTCLRKSNLNEITAGGGAIF